MIFKKSKKINVFNFKSKMMKISIFKHVKNLRMRNHRNKSKEFKRKIKKFDIANGRSTLL